MTACTNHGGKARRVVTAALVGVLSVGTVPMVALAAGAEADGIQTLVAEWHTGAKVTEAENGKGAAYTGDLSKPVSFDLGSGKYLVPTVISNQNGDETDVVDAGLKVTYGIPVGCTTNNFDGTWDGLLATGGIYKVDGKGTGLSVSAGADGLVWVDADFAASYFAGTLTDTRGNAVHTVAGTYKVNVSDGTNTKQVASFSLVDEDPYAGAYVYEYDSSDSDDTSDTTFVYNGADQAGKVRVADAKGNDLGTGTIRDSKGEVATTVINAGDYTVEFAGTNGKTYHFNFTVEKLDLSTASITVPDMDTTEIDLTTGTATDRSNLVKSELLLGGEKLSTVGNLSAKLAIDEIAGPNNFNYFIYTGPYTFKVVEATDDPNIEGEATVSFNYLDVDLYDTLDLYYGSSVVNSADGVTVNLTEGESFDASKIKVRSKDGATVYSGDQLEVTYVDNDSDKVVDASALTETGKYSVTVRVKPFQNADSDWVGGYEKFTVTVNGNEAYGTNVSFYLDGKVADATESVEYDGTDQLQRVSAKVANPEGGQFELGTDFVLEAKNEAGDVVESIVDAGEYTVSIKPLTFEFPSTEDGQYTITLEVTARQLTLLKNFQYNGDVMDQAGNVVDGEYVVANYKNSAVAWTGSAVEVPGVEYYDSEADAYVELDPSLYTVASIKKVNADNTTKAVKEAVDAGTYRVRIALSDEAKSNYALEDREFDFEVVKYAPFDDVESPAWYASAIADAKYTNIVHGIGGTDMFAPGAQITRAEAVCIVYNLAGGDNIDADYSFSVDGGYVTGFSDVDGHDYYARALAWAHNAGVVNGNGGKFDPDGKLTREQLAAMLANYAIATNDYEASDGSALAALPDASSVSDWAQGAVAWAVEKGIMGNGGSVMAQNTITRSEVAAMAVNYASKF